MENKVYTDKTPWILLIIVFSVLSAFFGKWLEHTDTPEPSTSASEQCDRYCRGVSRGGIMEWNEHGFACLCGDMEPRVWKKPSKKFEAVFSPDDAGVE